MSDGVLTVLRAKWRMLDNIVGQIRNYLWIHVAAGVFTLTLIVVGGGVFFLVLFDFLVGQEPFGPPLMERLMGIVFLAFFSMLVFSNLIITLTTTYISKETEFLVGLPIRFRSLFAIKLAEAVFYSSWAFALLSLPIFIAYGMAKRAPLPFYPAAAVVCVPFLVIPGCVGALITMLISAYLPARKARLYSAALLGAALGVTALLVRLMGLRSMVVSSSLEDFSQIMAFLNVGSVPLLPNYWLAQSLEALSDGRYRDGVYWFLCLLSTAMMSVQVCMWMVPRLYYRGWALAKETASPTQVASRRSLLTAMDSLFSRFSPPVRALLSKDMRTFWRDPAQWSQLIILFGLLIIYVANIQGLSRQLAALEVFIRHSRTILAFFNIGATCFVLSILTTRFIFPLLSLEGKQYWVVGLAPFPKEKLLWEKYGLCLAGTLGIGLSLAIFSSYVLMARPLLFWITIVTTLVHALGLTSLAVGLGAVFPNFNEDNPARIANGLGGTLNIILSLAFIAANMALEIWPSMYLADLLAARRGGGGAGTPEFLWTCLRDLRWQVAGFLIMNLLVIVVPMRIGLRNWRAMEFNL